MFRRRYCLTLILFSFLVLCAIAQANPSAMAQTLGGTEVNNERLEAEIAAYREALNQQTRERVPLRWAALQYDLGAALWWRGRARGDNHLGGHGSTEMFEEAATAFREALKEYTRERAPLQWAKTQRSLGDVLFSLFDEPGSGTTRVGEAVTAFREALKEYTRERYPSEWASIQMNLGNALGALGQRESGTTRFTEAIAAFQEALQVWTRAREPLQWAVLQFDLAKVLFDSHDKDHEPSGLDKALETVDAALEEYRKLDANPAFYIAKANHLHQQILAAKGKL